MSASVRPWTEEMRALCAILAEAPLTETVKWRWPCYQSAGRNIVLVHAFKAYCALLFFRGAELADAEGLLIRQTENVQSARQMRFVSLAEIAARRAAILDFVAQAIAVEGAGPRVEKAAPAATPHPPELEAAFAADPAFAAAFAALTPGRRRAYLLHFAGAKQAKTRAARVAAAVVRVMAGKGLTD